MANFSKARDIARTAPPSFQNKLFYCSFVSKYHEDYEMAIGYKDGAEVCLSNKSKEELEALYRASEALDDKESDYEKGFRSAIKDYIEEMDKWIGE